MNLVTAGYGDWWSGKFKRWLGWAGILGLILLIGGMGCGQVEPELGREVSPEPAPGQPQPNDAVEAELGTPNGETAPDAVVIAVKAAIASETAIAVDQLTVTVATAETWPDGCLGLGSDDELCTQALVPGWQLTVAAESEERTWVYHTDATGNQLRLADES